MHNEEAGSAGRMQAPPLRGGCDTPWPEENSDSLDEVRTAFLQFSSVSGTRLGAQGQGWEGSETGQLQSFLIRNRN